METFRNNIQYGRKLKKLSQQGLANLLNVSKNTIINWERSERQPPFDSVRAMCKIFGVTLNDFANVDWEVEGIPSKQGGQIERKKSNLLVRSEDLPTYCTQQQHFNAVAIPGISGSARTFEIADDGMLPLLIMGDFVACLPVSSYKTMVGGKIYVVAANNHVYVRHATSYHEGVHIFAHNQAGYGSMTIPYDQVLEVWEVVIRLTKNFLSPFSLAGFQGSHINEPASIASK